MPTKTRNPEALKEGIEMLHLLLAGLEAEVRAIDTQEVALEAKRDSIMQKERTIEPLDSHNQSLKRMVQELEETLAHVESKMASLRAKAKLLRGLEGVAKARSKRLDRKEDEIMTRLADSLGDVDHFESLSGKVVGVKGVEGEGMKVEVREGCRGRWVEVGPRVFYVQGDSGEVWVRLR